MKNVRYSRYISYNSNRSVDKWSEANLAQGGLRVVIHYSRYSRISNHGMPTQLWLREVAGIVALETMGMRM